MYIASLGPNVAVAPSYASRGPTVAGSRSEPATLGLNSAYSHSRSKTQQVFFTDFHSMSPTLWQKLSWMNQGIPLSWGCTGNALSNQRSIDDEETLLHSTGQSLARSIRKRKKSHISQSGISMVFRIFFVRVGDPIQQVHTAGPSRTWYGCPGFYPFSVHWTSH